MTSRQESERPQGRRPGTDAIDTAEQVAPDPELMEALHGFEAYLQEKKVGWPYSGKAIAQLAIDHFRAPSPSIGLRLLRYVAANNLLLMEKITTRNPDQRYFFHLDTALVFGVLIRELLKTTYDHESHSGEYYFEAAITQVKKRLGSDPLAKVIHTVPFAAQPVNVRDEDRMLAAEASFNVGKKGVETVVFAREKEKRPRSPQKRTVDGAVVFRQEGSSQPVAHGDKLGKRRGRKPNELKIIEPQQHVLVRKTLGGLTGEQYRALEEWNHQRVLNALNVARSMLAAGDEVDGRFIPDFVQNLLINVYNRINGLAPSQFYGLGARGYLLMEISRVVRNELCAAVLKSHPNLYSLRRMLEQRVLEAKR